MNSHLLRVQGPDTNSIMLPQEGPETWRGLISTTQLIKNACKALCILVFMAAIPILLFGSLSRAAEEETPKAVRRASPESVSVSTGRKRVALIIGNSEYKEAPLRNPAHDAEDIAKVLGELGFTVHTKINASQQEMEEVVQEFVSEIQNGDVGLFYFSGHGVQVGGDNYLIPVGSSFETETDVRFKAVNAGFILGKMEESRDRTNIFILDACRNNPFKGFRSLSKGLTGMDARVGTFIAYATAPGSVALDGTDRNSPYAKHIMEAMRPAGVKIEDVFKRVLRSVEKETGGKQIPWVASSLREDFYFNPSREAAAVGPEPPSPAATANSGPAPDDKARIEKEKREAEQEIAKLQEARKAAALEREQLEREKQEISRERERLAAAPARTPTAPVNSGDPQAVNPQAAAAPAPGPSPDDKARIEKEKREAEQEIAKLQEARKAAALAREALEREKQAMLRERERIASPPALAPEPPINSDDPELAKLKKLAEQGRASAQNNLARKYQDGEGVPRDYAEAMKCYRKAADQGYAAAQANLGDMYREGPGGDEDYEEALKWYQKAAKQGNSSAQYQLGLMFKNGNGVDKDKDKARKWFAKAADQGHQEAKKELTSLGGRPAPARPRRSYGGYGGYGGGY